MTPDDIATEIYSELDSPTNISVSGVSYWLRSNVGRLNNVIFTSFNTPLSGAGEFYQTVASGQAPMRDKEKDIFKCIYDVSFYTRKISSSMGAADLDPIIEIESDGARVRKINRNEMSKTWLQLKNATNLELKDKIFAYNYGEASPQQVAGDDTIFSNSSDAIDPFRI